MKIDYQIMNHEPVSSPKRKQAPVTRAESPSGMGGDIFVWGISTLTY